MFPGPPPRHPPGDASFSAGGPDVRQKACSEAPAGPFAGGSAPCTPAGGMACPPNPPHVRAQLACAPPPGSRYPRALAGLRGHPSLSSVTPRPPGGDIRPAGRPQVSSPLAGRGRVGSLPAGRPRPSRPSAPSPSLASAGEGEGWGGDEGLARRAGEGEGRGGGEGPRLAGLPLFLLDHNVLPVPRPGSCATSAYHRCPARGRYRQRRPCSADSPGRMSSNLGKLPG